LFPYLYSSYLIVLQQWPIPTEVEDEQHVLWI
jgi:hypothetical protein